LINIIFLTNANKQMNLFLRSSLITGPHNLKHYHIAKIILIAKNSYRKQIVVSIRVSKIGQDPGPNPVKFFSHLILLSRKIWLPISWKA